MFMLQVRSYVHFILLIYIEFVDPNFMTLRHNNPQLCAGPSKGYILRVTTGTSVSTASMAFLPGLVV